MSNGSSTSALPIISIAPYLSANNGTEKQATSAAIHDACQKYGFFYLDISSFADSQETEELCQLGREFFALPDEVKDRIALRNEDGVRGYARLRENITNGKTDNHEGLDFYRPVDNPDKTKPLWGTNQWPDSIPQFREKYEKWVEKMETLGLIVMEAMAVGLGMTSEEWDRLRSQVDNSFWVMRLIGYPPLPSDHDGFSCGAHKDYGCLTFLYTDPTPNALQVFVQNPEVQISSEYLADVSGLPLEQGAEDGVWITANPIPGCVVCNIGEMWEIWTDGLYKSTLHRVVHRADNFRVSIPFFFEPNFDAFVEPLAVAKRIKSTEKVNETKTYKPVVYGDFLLSKVSNNFDAGGNKKY